MRWHWTVFQVVVVSLLFAVIKFGLGFPSADINVIGIILTIASILFGFLAGFFISELWTRYTEIRELEGVRSSENLNILRYAEYFFDNKEFEKDFKHRLEKSAIADQLIFWNEGHLEIDYFRDIEKSFKHVELKGDKDSEYFDNLLDSYKELVSSIVKLDTLYKERLFPSEWFIIVALSVIIAISLLFLDVSHLFYKIIIIVFPAIIVLAIRLLHDLNTMNWNREMITLGSNSKVFDALGVSRMYVKRDIQYIPKDIDYRTEDDLEGDFREMHEQMLEARKKEGSS